MPNIPIIYGTAGEIPDGNFRDLWENPPESIPFDYLERVNNPTFNGVWPILEEARLRRELNTSFKKLRKVIKNSPPKVDLSLAFLDNLI